MGRPFRKCLRRVGVPAAVMYLGFSIVDVAKHRASVPEAFATNLFWFAALWLAVSALFCVLTRVVPPHQAGR